jgi:nucleoside-triphosphatase
MREHIFLTGEIQVGKSTIIRKAVERLCIAPAGFRTVWREVNSERVERLCLLPFGADMGQGDSSVAVAAVRDFNVRRFEARPDVFDEVGVRILSDVSSARRAGLIVMDELGFIEDNAALFQSAVLDCLDGQIPVVGAIKPRSTPFLNAVRAHSRVRIFEVTLENRNGLVDVVADALFGMMK